VTAAYAVGVRVFARFFGTSFRSSSTIIVWGTLRCNECDARSQFELSGIGVHATPSWGGMISKDNRLPQCAMVGDFPGLAILINCVLRLICWEMGWGMRWTQRRGGRGEE